MTEQLRLLFDAELAWKVHDHLVAHPEEHDQPNWANLVLDETRQHIQCGTTGCFAGHLAFMMAPMGTKFWNTSITLPDNDGRNTMYDSYAKHLLTKGTTTSTDPLDPWHGLTEEQRQLHYAIDGMFYANNSISDIAAHIRYLEKAYPST